MDDNNARRKRVNRLKKIIIIVVIALILVPTCLCIIMFVRFRSTNKELKQIEEKLDNLLALKSNGDIIEKVNEETGDVFYVYAAKDKNSSEPVEDVNAKKVYLTFDDGPSEMTNQILDILKEYDVKATFFVNGRTDEASLAAYKRIVQEGHAIGIHTYSHDYSKVYESVESFGAEVESLKNLIYETTGVKTNLFRFPGGSSTTLAKNTGIQPLIDYLNNNGYIYFDWNVSSGDSTAGGLGEEQIVDNVVSHVAEVSVPVVLMHDSKQKTTSVLALPVIIENLKSAGYEFGAIDENVAAVHHVIK